MNPWSEERVRQLDTDTITAFGIRLVSRHANAAEMVELIEFACAATQANVNMFVTRAHYDSKQSCCSFDLSAALEGAGQTAEQALFSAALRTLSQFLWFGRIHRGRDDPAPPLPR